MQDRKVKQICQNKTDDKIQTLKKRTELFIKKWNLVFVNKWGKQFISLI